MCRVDEASESYERTLEMAASQILKGNRVPDPTDPLLEMAFQQVARDNPHFLVRIKTRLEKEWGREVTIEDPAMAVKDYLSVISSDERKLDLVYLAFKAVRTVIMTEAVRVEAEEREERAKAARLRLKGTSSQRSGRAYA